MSYWQIIFDSSDQFNDSFPESPFFLLRYLTLNDAQPVLVFDDPVFFLKCLTEELQVFDVDVRLHLEQTVPVLCLLLDARLLVQSRCTESKEQLPLFNSKSININDVSL